MAELEKELNWDDTIENDSPGFLLLPEGDYEFKVLSFERARHPGSAKLPPCNKAVLNLEISAPEGRTTVRHNLFLHTKCEGMLCAFFAAIGQRKHGEALKMNWNSVPGSTGRCRIGVHIWTRDDGSEGKNNEVKRFYEAEEKPKFKPGAF